MGKAEYPVQDTGKRGGVTVSYIQTYWDCEFCIGSICMDNQCQIGDACKKRCEYQEAVIRIVLEQMEQAEALAKRMKCEDLDIGKPYREMIGRIRRGEY